MVLRKALLLSSLGVVLGCGDPAGASRVCADIALSGSALVLESSYQASGLGRIDETGCLTEIPDVLLGADPSLSVGATGAFVVARSEALVLPFEPDTLSIAGKLVPYVDEAELSTPFVFPGCSDRQTQGINPHDADRDATGRVWVARYEKPSLGLIRPDGSYEGSVDLSAFADADGLPEAEAIRIVGDRAYAMLERLDRCNAYQPAGNGKIAVIDVATRAVVGEIDLGGTNPFGRMRPAPWDAKGSLVAIALPGQFAAIELGNAAVLVDLETGEVTRLLEESAVSGSVAEVVVAAKNEGYAIVAGTAPENPTRVVRFDPEAQLIGPTILDSQASGGKGNYNHLGLAVVGEHLLVGDRAYGAPAIHVVERVTGLEVATLRPARFAPVALSPSP